jgi:hypothetical protein
MSMIVQTTRFRLVNHKGPVARRQPKHRTNIIREGNNIEAGGVQSSVSVL